MKKIIATIAILLLLCGTSYSAQSGARQLVGSSGALTASGEIKATGGVVYGASGVTTAGAASLIHICDGDSDDSETAANQYITLGNVDGGTISYSCPNGIYFPNGIYLNEKSGNVTITVIYE